MKEYGQYYFAFMDLLGFKEIVKSHTCEEIAEIFDEAKKQFIINQIVDEKSIPVVPPRDIHYYVMSDSVCIFIRDDIKSALPVLTWLCLDFQVRMLCQKKPVFVRGSIVRGKVFAEQNVLFGPAMVEAYIRAEKLAQYPRIIIPQDLCEEITDTTDKAFMNGFTHLEQDGFFVINYLDYFSFHASAKEHREGVINYVNHMINDSLDQSVRDKYLYVQFWLDYYTKQREAEAHEQ